MTQEIDFYLSKKHKDVMLRIRALTFARVVKETAAEVARILPQGDAQDRMGNLMELCNQFTSTIPDIGD